MKKDNKTALAPYIADYQALITRGLSPGAALAEIATYAHPSKVSQLRKYLGLCKGT